MRCFRVGGQTRSSDCRPTPPPSRSRQAAHFRGAHTQGDNHMTSSSTAEFIAQEAETARPTAPADGALLFYTHTLCPYAERVWLTLLEKGVPFRLIHVDLSNKPSWYRSVNSRGLVPAVEQAGTVHTESVDICAWLDTAFEGSRSLTPADPAMRAHMQQLGSELGSSLSSAGLQLLAGRGRVWGVSSGAPEAEKARFVAQLERLAAAVEQHGRPYLLGAHPTLADLLIYPFMSRFALAAPHFSGLDVRAAAGGAVGRWLGAMEARPSCATTTPDRDLFLEALQQHASLDFFDYTTYPVFQLHPHNLSAQQQV